MIATTVACVQIARREVDAKEQEFQDELRRQQIEKANRQLHDSQDMVKALKSKMLVSDVMKEQDAQREYIARKEAIQKNIEQNWEELEKQKMEEYDSKMRAKLEREYNKKMENAKAISDQLEEFKINFIKQLKEDMLEGELIKRQTEEDLEREKIRELQRMSRSSFLVGLEGLEPPLSSCCPHGIGSRRCCVSRGTTSGGT